jgi:hypothetical protein
MQSSDKAETCWNIDLITRDIVIKPEVLKRALLPMVFSELVCTRPFIKLSVVKDEAAIKVYC